MFVAILEPPFTDCSSEASEDKRKRRLAEDDRRQVLHTLKIKGKIKAAAFRLSYLDFFLEFLRFSALFLMFLLE